MKKRFLSIFLSFCMVLALLPVTSFAETDEIPVCTCETACAADSMNPDCPLCGAEGAEACGKSSTADEPVEPTALEQVQALINALPDADTITEENRADVEAQLTAIDDAKSPLGDEERDMLDFGKYNAAIAALNVLDDMEGAEVPAALEEEAVTSEEALKAAVANGDTVKLGGNITLSETLTIKNTVTLDLNGHTLTGGTNGSYGGNGITAITVENGGDLTIVNSSSTAGSIIGGNGYSHIISKDEYNNGNGGNGGHGLSVIGGTVNIDADCTISGGNGGKGRYSDDSDGGNGGAGGHGLSVNGGIITINNGTIKGGNGGNGGSGHNNGGNGGAGGDGLSVNGGTVNIDADCAISGGNGDNSGGGNAGNGGTGGHGLSVSGGTVNIDADCAISGGNGGNDVYGENAAGGKAISGYIITFMKDDITSYMKMVVPVNGTVTKPAVPSKENSIFGGWYEKDSDTFKDTAFDFNTAITADTTLYAKWVAADYSWYDADASEYTITTAAQLLGFANLVNGTDGQTATNYFAGKTVKLGADIDLSGIANWTPIGKDGAPFMGTFDGGGHKISGLTVNSTGQYDYGGLFGKITKATVQNLSVSGSVTSNGIWVGGIVGYLSGKIENCSFSGSVIGGWDYIGGIVGSAYGTISKCSNTATVSGSAVNLGGIVGNTRNTNNIRYCYNQGKVTSSGNNASAGGIVGSVLEYSSIEVRSCYNTGAVSATGTSASVGRIVGNVVSYSSLTVTDVYCLDSSVQNGIGSVSGSVSGSAVGKDTAAFTSGEVAYLLQSTVPTDDGQVWGQRIGKDTYPVFANGNNKVYKVTFVVDGDSTVKYVNGDLNGAPTPTAPTGYVFGGWYTEADGGTKVTAITADTTLYAKWSSNSSNSGGGGSSSSHTRYTIQANAGKGGTISPADSTSVRSGSSKTFTITPDTGYLIADVTVDGESIGAVSTYTFSNVKKNHTITAAFAEKAETPQPSVDEPSADIPFADVTETDWFYQDVAYAYANQLMNGTSDTAFSPNLTTTRGMIVSILYRLEGTPAVSGECAYNDVKAGSYYEKAIIWAEENGIVSGYGNGNFGPDDSITREQMAVILYRFAQYKGLDVSVGEDTNILSYQDAQEISAYAFSAMQWICGENILSGSDGNLMPQGNATRAQVAAILHRFCETVLA